MDEHQAAGALPSLGVHLCYASGACNGKRTNLIRTAGLLPRLLGAGVWFCHQMNYTFISGLSRGSENGSGSGSGGLSLQRWITLTTWLVRGWAFFSCASTTPVVCFLAAMMMADGEFNRFFCAIAPSQSPARQHAGPVLTVQQKVYDNRRLTEADICTSPRNLSQKIRWVHTVPSPTSR